MKNYKFRVYNKEENKMYYDIDTLIFNEIGLSHVVINNKTYNVNENIVVMQYIGLKDTNNKDMFEHDIVRITDDYLEESYHVIQYQSDLDYPAYDLHPIYSEECNSISNCIATIKIEVIGNKYENGDLLKLIK